MIGLFLGGTDFPSLILKNIKKYNKNILLSINKKINLKKIKIVILLVLENLVKF